MGSGLGPDSPGAPAHRWRLRWWLRVLATHRQRERGRQQSCSDVMCDGPQVSPLVPGPVKSVAQPPRLGTLKVKQPRPRVRVIRVL